MVYGTGRSGKRQPGRKTSGDLRPDATRLREVPPPGSRGMVRVPEQAGTRTWPGADQVFSDCAKGSVRIRFFVA
jgi:hypothetical protein